MEVRPSFGQEKTFLVDASMGSQNGQRKAWPASRCALSGICGYARSEGARCGCEACGRAFVRGLRCPSSIPLALP
eukprot:6183377-Pleurochrysis_carterae.AAC.8